MEADGKGRIVSSPRIITADQTKALIEQGTEYLRSHCAYVNVQALVKTAELVPTQCGNNQKQKHNKRLLVKPHLAAKWRQRNVMKTADLIENGGISFWLFNKIYLKRSINRKSNKIPLCLVMCQLLEIFSKIELENQRNAKCWFL